MKLIKLQEDTYVNSDDIRCIFLSINDSKPKFPYVINIKTDVIFPYREYPDRSKALYELSALVDFIMDGGTNLEDYRSLIDFEQDVWNAYRDSGVDSRSLRIARYMLLESDPDALVIMRPEDIALMMDEEGICEWKHFTVEKITEFQTFLTNNMDTHPEWFS